MRHAGDGGGFPAMGAFGNGDDDETWISGLEGLRSCIRGYTAGTVPPDRLDEAMKQHAEYLRDPLFQRGPDAEARCVWLGREGVLSAWPVHGSAIAGRQRVRVLSARWALAGTAALT